MDEAAERHTDCKDWLAGIAEWLPDYISWLTGWTVDQLDKRSHTLNPPHLFLYKCQTAVGSVCWPDWEGERDGKRAGREGEETDGERETRKDRETELNRDIESCQSISTVTARRLLLIT